MRRKKTELQKLKDALWEECKRITRKRHGYTCYTCGVPVDHPHTGHFITSSTCSVLMRYSLENLRPQCYSCNVHKSGNWVLFERRLRAEGVDTEELKKRNEESKLRQYDVLWYKEKLEEYRLL